MNPLRYQKDWSSGFLMARLYFCLNNWRALVDRNIAFIPSDTSDENVNMCSAVKLLCWDDHRNSENAEPIAFFAFMQQTFFLQQFFLSLDFLTFLLEDCNTYWKQLLSPLPLE